MSPYPTFLKHGAAIRGELVVPILVVQIPVVQATHVLIHPVGQCLLSHLADLLILGIAVGILVAKLIAIALGITLARCKLAAEGLLAKRVAHLGGRVVAAGVLSCAQILRRSAP